MSRLISKLVEEHQTILVPPAGVTASQLRLSLWHLVDVTLARFMDGSKSVEIDAPELQLSIIVNATGEQQTRESSTSTTQPGEWSPKSLSLEDSSESPSDPLTGMNEAGVKPVEKLTVPSRTQHMFEGRLLGNCKNCQMPLSASQHYDLYTHAGIVFQAQHIKSYEEDPALD